MAPTIHTWAGVLSFVIFLLFGLPVDALPKRKTLFNTASNSANAATSKTANGAGRAGAGAAAAGKISTATDGSTILDKTVTIDGLSIRYKISAPANQFTAASGVTGGTATANSVGANGLNVLLHGDGGQSFVDFPNQEVQNNLMGVVVLAPNQDRFWGGGSGLERTDGVAHAAAVNTLIQDQLSKDVAFDPTNVFFTGVSGGSLLLSGFFMPAFGSIYQTGVELNCGALAPQVAVVDGANMIANTKFHFQSTQDELALLQPAIPEAIIAYEQLASNAGLTAAEIGALQTADSTPNGGGHCGFDGQGFVSGVQLMANNFANVMSADATGEIAEIGNVLTSVVGNEALKFTSAT